MKNDRAWQGVRLRQIAIGEDPDAPTRPVRLPAAWDDASAAALCALAPGKGAIELPALVQAWAGPLDARGRAAGMSGLGDRLQSLLLLRRAAPLPDVWRGAANGVPGFVLNLASFHAAGGFDVDGFATAVDAIGQALRLLPGAGTPVIALADLAGLLAALGLDYAGKPARDVGACLAGLLRGRAEAALAGQQLDLLAAFADWPTSPVNCAVPGLAEAALAARRAGTGAVHIVVQAPGAVEALLGCETGGIAPAFSPVGVGGLTRTARAWLTARGVGLEATVAALVAGEPVFPVARAADHAAMHDAIAPMLHAMPPRPAATPPAQPRLVAREDLPARRRGYTQKAAVGGHRVFLRTGEYADGRLGEIGIALPRESAATRGLADSLATAVSVGLQHGVPLDSFVDALAHQRFAPAGVVEGDPVIDRAASLPDYVFRSLAAAYLGRVIPAETEPAPPPAAEAPLLPLDLPRAPRKPALRLVAA